MAMNRKAESGEALPQDAEPVAMPGGRRRRGVAQERRIFPQHGDEDEADPDEHEGDARAGCYRRDGAQGGSPAPVDSALVTSVGNVSSGLVAPCRQVSPATSIRSREGRHGDEDEAVNHGCGRRGGAHEGTPLDLPMRGLARHGTTCDARNLNVSMVPTAGGATDHGHMENKSAVMGFSMEAGKPAVEHEKQWDAQKYRADSSDCECDNPDSASTESPDSSEITEKSMSSLSVHQLVKEYEKKVGKGRGACSTCSTALSSA